MKKINNFSNSNIKPDELIENLNATRFHNFAGNTMRNTRIEEIYYDDKWKTELPAYLRVILGILFYIPDKLLVYKDSVKTSD